MKKFLIVFGIIIIILVAIGGIGSVLLVKWYNNNLLPVKDANSSESIQVEIKKGIGTEGIANLLEQNNVIKNATVFKIYVKLNKISNLQAGKYEFQNGNDDLKAIVSKISKGEVLDETITLKLIEGKTIEDYAKVIAENTKNTEEDVYNLLKNEEFINSLIEKYWFITDEIKNEDIYYTLEGYLKPDTYTLENEEVSVEYIFNFILNYTDKFLSNYRQEIENSGLTVHQILSLASVVELEGNSSEERSGIAGVFYNRLKSGMSLGSDVTTYYAFHVKMSESDLTKEQINTYNPYNTRHTNMAGKLPVGPICNISSSSIEAVLRPTNTDCYYFVSDKNGKAYFTKTYTEHQKIIKELKDNNLWYTYK